MVNGRWVYQKPGEDRFLEYGDKYWLGNSGVGRKSGHLHHHGGSVCPEHIQGDWEISHQDEDDGTWSWQIDEDLTVECVTEEKKDVREKTKQLLEELTAVARAQLKCADMVAGTLAKVLPK